MSSMYAKNIMEIIFCKSAIFLHFFFQEPLQCQVNSLLYDGLSKDFIGTNTQVFDMFFP